MIIDNKIIYFNSKIFFYEYDLLRLAFKYRHFYELIWTIPLMWKQCVRFKGALKV